MINAQDFFEYAQLKRTKKSTKYGLTEAHSEPTKTSKMWAFYENSSLFSDVNYFGKKLHFKCLTIIWIQICMFLHECLRNNQLTFTCSKSIIKTLQKRMKYVQS